MRRRLHLALPLRLRLAALGADPEGARAKQEEGLKAYADGRFDDAVDAFRTAYALDDEPIYLFSWGQAEVARGDCAAAVEVRMRPSEAGNAVNGDFMWGGYTGCMRCGHPGPSSLGGAGGGGRR